VTRPATVRPVRALVLCALLGTTIAPGSVASAQDAAPDPSVRATARALFQEGVGFVDALEWAQAADRFERALALYDSAVIRFNLATVYDELGRLVEASEHLRDVIRRDDADEDVRQAARDRLTAVDARIAHLTIRVEGEADEVTRDDVPVPTVALGVSAPVDPGSHTLRAMRGGEVVATETVELAEAASEEVVLSVPPAVVIPDPVLPDPDPALSDEPFYAQWWFWSLIGVVVVGAAVGIGVGVGVSQESPPCAGDFMPCRIDLP